MTERAKPQTAKIKITTKIDNSKDNNKNSKIKLFYLSVKSVSLLVHHQFFSCHPARDKNIATIFDNLLDGICPFKFINHVKVLN
jgi:hypothetical protein